MLRNCDSDIPQELEIIAGRYTDIISLAANFKLTDDKLEIFTAEGDVLEYIRFLR